MDTAGPAAPGLPGRPQYLGLAEPPAETRAGAGHHERVRQAPRGALGGTPPNRRLSPEPRHALRCRDAQPGNLFTYAHYRLIAVLGLVPDVVYTPRGYQPAAGVEPFSAQAQYSDWFHVRQGSPAQTLELALVDLPATPAFSLVLSLGISFGVMSARGWVEVVKHAGSARVLAVA
jgi:hypothetical protein